MSTSIEQRLAVLEREVGALKQVVQGSGAERDWRKTFGMSADDPGFEEMIRLGRQAREEAREDDD